MSKSILPLESIAVPLSEVNSKGALDGEGDEGARSTVGTL